MSGLTCGSCNLCCKLLGVPDIGKPVGMLCWWTGVHGGCQRQNEKETDEALKACAQFECFWLASQRQSDPDKMMSRMLRPDILHVVFGPRDPTNRDLLYVHVDPNFPDAWQKPAARVIIDEILSRGKKIEIHIGPNHISLPFDAVAA